MSIPTIINPAEPVDYASGKAPDSYACGTCGIHQVKLWRRYQTFMESQDLFCAQCARAEAAPKYDGILPPVSEWDARTGRHTDKYGMKTDQLGWLIPAVPTIENDTFWGYTSVPDEGCQWWSSLPLQSSTMPTTAAVIPNE
jgi:hypothetical protein